MLSKALYQAETYKLREAVRPCDLVLDVVNYGTPRPMFAMVITKNVYIVHKVACPVGSRKF